MTSTLGRGRVPQLNPEFTDSAGLPAQCGLRILSLPPEHWDYGWTAMHTTFMGCWGSELQSPCAQPVLWSLGNLPSPSNRGGGWGGGGVFRERSEWYIWTTAFSTTAIKITQLPRRVALHSTDAG